MTTLLCMYADDTNLRKLQIPVRGDGVEDQTEVPGLAWLNGRGGDWLGIHVGLPGTDQTKRQRHPLCELAYITMETDLDGDRTQGLIPGVGKLSVDVGDFGPGKAGGFTHLQAADGELGRIGV